MERRVLITTGNGMFGRALIQSLMGVGGVKVRAMVRDRAKFSLSGSNLEVVTGDMGRPETLIPAVAGCTHVFLSAPMDAELAQREINVVDAAKSAGAHVLKIYGAVRHEGDVLVHEHERGLEHLKASGLSWTLISPNSVMETSLLPMAETLKYGSMFGISGKGYVGLVALKDVADSTRAVILSEGHSGKNYELTGPAACNMYDMAGAFTRLLGRRIVYYDLPEDILNKMLLENSRGMTKEKLEFEVICHLRAWRENRADLVTDTVSMLTGRPARSLDDWLSENRDKFDLHRSLTDRMLTLMFRVMYGKYAAF
jgi:uncharacterized protein YbjT (DUF2867 family)